MLPCGGASTESEFAAGDCSRNSYLTREADLAFVAISRVRDEFAFAAGQESQEQTDSKQPGIIGDSHPTSSADEFVSDPSLDRRIPQARIRKGVSHIARYGRQEPLPLVGSRSPSLAEDPDRRSRLQMLPAEDPGIDTLNG
jgi:hypothetical protein